MKYENTILQGPAEDQLKTLDNDSIDLIVTDPPYGYSFMNKDWDKAVIPVDTWKQCLRVLKAGAFAFIMSSPRQDVLCKMILNLIEAGFETNFTSLYWTYASGFPKAADVSKLVDKRNGRDTDVNISLANYLKQKRLEKGLTREQMNDKLGVVAGYTWYETTHQPNFRLPTMDYYQKIKTILDLDNRFDKLIEREEAEREIIGSNKYSKLRERMPKKYGTYSYGEKGFDWTHNLDETKPATPQAKRLQGAYAGFQPKPAVELILTVMKPLSQKTYVDQALSNQKGITWLDDCRIPYQSEEDKATAEPGSLIPLHYRKFTSSTGYDRIVNEPQEPNPPNDKGRFPANLLVEDNCLNDGKITKSTRQLKARAGDVRFTGRLYAHCKEQKERFDKYGGYNDEGSFSRYFSLDSWTEKTLPFLIVPKPSKAEKGENNSHPTVKSCKLMSYLITMGSREGDVVLDPFCGSGTVLIAARQLARDFIGCEINGEYVQIANTRLKPYLLQTRLL